MSITYAGLLLVLTMAVSAHAENALSRDPNEAMYAAKAIQNLQVREVWGKLSKEEHQFALSKYPYLDTRIRTNAYWMLDFRGVIAMLFPRFTMVVDEKETGLLPMLQNILKLWTDDKECLWVKWGTCPGDLVLAVYLKSDFYLTGQTSPCSLRDYIPGRSVKVHTREWLKTASLKDVMDVFRSADGDFSCSPKIAQVLAAIDIWSQLPREHQQTVKGYLGFFFPESVSLTPLELRCFIAVILPGYSQRMLGDQVTHSLTAEDIIETLKSRVAIISQHDCFFTVTPPCRNSFGYIIWEKYFNEKPLSGLEEATPQQMLDLMPEMDIVDTSPDHES